MAIYIHTIEIVSVYFKKISNDILTLSRYASIFLFNFKNYLQINMYVPFGWKENGYKLMNFSYLYQCKPVYACTSVQLNHPYSYCRTGKNIDFYNNGNILKAKYLMSTMKTDDSDSYTVRFARCYLINNLPLFWIEILMLMLKRFHNSSKDGVKC